MRRFATSLRWELLKLRAQPAAWLGIVLTGGFVVAFAALLHLPAAHAAMRRILERIDGPSADTLSGLTVAQFAVGQAMGFVGSMFLALVAATTVAGEVRDGTMHAILSRPVSRLRVLSVKLVACGLYTATLLLAATSTALLSGLLLEGPGPMVVIVPEAHIQVRYAFADGLLLYGWAAGSHLVSLLTIPALAFCAACCGLGAGTAAAGSLALLFADEMLRTQPWFAAYRAHFLMTRIAGWSGVYAGDAGWRWLLETYAPLLALDATLIGLGAWVFCRRDLKR